MSKLHTLLPRLQGEILEISVGDEFEELITSDTVRKVNSVIYGKLVDIVDDFIILDCFFINKNGELNSGNIVYINTWAIKAFSKLKSNGSLNDVFMSVADNRKIKYLLGWNEQ